MQSLSTFSLAHAALSAHRAAGTNDIAKCVNSDNVKYGFSQKTFDAGVSYKVDFSTVFALPQKQVMRAVQLINALYTQAYDSLDFTHARILCAMRLAGSYDLTTDAIVALAGATRNDSVNTRGISYSALNTMFKNKHGASTIQTKMSNSTGKNGIFQHMGMTFAAPGETNHTVSLNDSSPLVIRFFELINKGTVGQLEQMSGSDK